MVSKKGLDKKLSSNMLIHKETDHIEIDALKKMLHVGEEVEKTKNQ